MKKILLIIFCSFLFAVPQINAQLFSQTFGTSASFPATSSGLQTNATYINNTNPSSSQFTSINFTSGGVSMTMNSIANTLEVVQTGSSGKIYINRNINLGNLSHTTLEIKFNLSITNTNSSSGTAFTFTVGNGWTTTGSTAPTPNFLSIPFSSIGSATQSGQGFKVNGVNSAQTTSSSLLPVVIFANASSSSVTYAGPAGTVSVAAGTYLIYVNGALVGSVLSATVATCPLNSFCFAFAPTKPTTTIDISNLQINDPFNASDYYYQSGDITQPSNWNSLSGGGGTLPSSLNTVVANMHVPSNATVSSALNLPNANLSIENNAILTVGSGGSITLGAGSLLTVNSGCTLNLGGNPFILQSNSNSSTTILPVNGTISGATNVTVQRYIGSTSASSTYPWRMIGFPLTNSTTISASTLSTQYGTGYNAYLFNESADDGNYNAAGTTTTGTVNNGWQSFTGTSTASASQGILIAGGTPTATLNATGTLNTGNINYNGTKNAQGWNLAANPYPSNLDWSHFYNTTNGGFSSATTVSPSYYRYDPNSTAYVSYNAVTSTPSNSSLINNVIPNGAGFFIQVLVNNTPINISESDKTSSTPTATLFGVNTKPKTVTLDGAGSSTSSSDKSIVRLNLKQDNDVYGSEIVVRWGGGFNATDLFDSKYDAYDLGRMKGADLAAVDAKGTAYSIFHGSDLKSSDIENRTVALKVSQLTEGSYTLTANIESPIANGNQLSIYDRYLNQYTLIDGSSKTYSFTVNSIPASQASDRFSLVMNAKDEADNGTSTVSLLNNPTSGNSFTLYSQANFNTLQWNLVDGNGNGVGAGQLNNLQKGATYKVNTPVIANGLYFIKLVGDNKKLNTLKLMKQ